MEFLHGLSLEHPQLTLGNGYDHNFVLSRQTHSPMRLAAKATRWGSVSGVLDHPAGHSTIYCQLLGRHARKGRGLLWSPVGLLSGDTGLAGCRPPSGVPAYLLRAGERYHHVTTYRAAIL